MEITNDDGIIEYKLEKSESTLIGGFSYILGNLVVYFQDNLDIKYFPNTYHYNVPKKLIFDWINSDSFGRFYNQYIKNKFMAKSDRIINCKIDLKKVNKEWLFKSEETGAIYLDFVIFQNDTPDKYGQNGMIVQSVPKDVRELDKDAKGEILGNVKIFTPVRATPGVETGTRIGAQGNGAAAGTGLNYDDEGDDLPF